MPHTLPLALTTPPIPRQHPARSFHVTPQIRVLPFVPVRSLSRRSKFRLRLLVPASQQLHLPLQPFCPRRHGRQLPLSFPQHCLMPLRLRLGGLQRLLTSQ